MKKYLFLFFLFISIQTHAEDIKLKCLMQISYTSNFDASENSQENVLLTINELFILVENSGSRLSGLFRSSHPKITASDFSDSNKWSISNQNDLVPLASTSVKINIDRNTGNISYQSITNILKSGKIIDTSEVKGNGLCDKVDVSKRRF